MSIAPHETRSFGRLEALGAPPSAGQRIGRAAGAVTLLVLSLALVAGACAFAFGPSRTLFDHALLPKTLLALLGLSALRRLAGEESRRGSRTARAALSLLFLVGAFCFVNEAWSFLRRAW